MIIGMTGTRKGLTTLQKAYAKDVIPWDSVEELHSGDCVGADTFLHKTALLNSVWSVGHPPVKKHLRAYCDFDETLSIKTYMARNKDIVNASDKLYGFPPSEVEGRGGTWSTIKFAKSRGKPVVVITPLCKVTEYN